MSAAIRSLLNPAAMNTSLCGNREPDAPNCDAWWHSRFSRFPNSRMADCKQHSNSLLPRGSDDCAPQCDYGAVPIVASSLRG